MEAPQKPLVAILLSPGVGHLIPFVELARKLIQLHNFAITFIIPDDDSPIKPQKSLLEAFSPSINSIYLPLAGGRNLPADAKIEIRIMSSVIECLPALRDALIELSKSNRLSAFVVDNFGVATFDLVKQLGIPFYIFSPSNAMLLSFIFRLPELDESCSCEYRDLPEPVKLPGCVPLKGADFPDPVQDRKNEVYKRVAEKSKTTTLADGILINSFFNLEPNTLKALDEQVDSSNRPPVYPVGPLIRPRSSNDKSDCLKWLDQQPLGSVLFVSFGSGGTLSTMQLRELASGLEMSQQRFLLVARTPNEEAKNAAYFIVGAEDKTDSFEYLPTNFIKRTKERGFVVSQWAPQIEVLSHPAVGGFLTHCGWNSIMESIVHGVPLIAWPLYAEQKMNAVLLSEDLKVAIRVKQNENGVVESEEVSRAARRLMEGEEGEEIRERMRNLKDYAGRALEEDGSSAKSLAMVARKWIGEQRAKL